jgi:uncharacterized protein (DUF58 family)
MDTHLGSKPTPSRYEDFEAALSMAASIADFLSRQEYIIDVFAAGPQIYILEAGRSLAHLDQVLEVLACLEPCPDNPFELIEPVLVERMSLLTTVIVVLLSLDEARLTFLQHVAMMGVGVKVVVCNGKTMPNLPGLDESKIVALSAKRIREGIETL